MTVFPFMTVLLYTQVDNAVRDRVGFVFVMSHDEDKNQR